MKPNLRVSWVLPFLNEEQLLPLALERLAGVLDRVSVGLFGIMGDGIRDGVHPVQMEVILLDSGSRDRSGGIARDWITDQTSRGRSSQTTMRWVNTELTSKPEGPSLGRALAALRNGEASPQGDWILILPVDCALSPEAVDGFVQQIQRDASTTEGGGSTSPQAGMLFLKAYDPSTFTLRIYAGLQNWIRLRGLKLGVWTNGITISRSAWNDVEVPQDGFLEDVIWVDRLLARYGRSAFRVIESPLEVCSRRYYPNRIWRRIAVNGWVMLLFRFGLRSVSELRKIYHSLA